MKRRVFVLLALLMTAGSGTLRGGCGTSSCPLDPRALNLTQRGFTLDLAFQYIDQDQPRIGTHDAHVGEVPGAHHDEVRTVNRITNALLTYAPNERASVSASVPFVSRDHDHLGMSHGHVTSQDNVIPQSWSLRGVGDITLEARVAIAGFNPSLHSGLWAIGGVKLPTGKHDLQNTDGQVAELPVQPGSGTTDGILGLSYQGGVVRRTSVQGEAGDFAAVPYFLTATYQFRNGAADGYRFGNELQVSAGGAYPLRRDLEVLLQLNSRFRAKDHIDSEPDEEELTGGTYVYVSPGLRLSFGRSALYAIMQMPVHQDVNGLQLTSNANYIAGVQTRF